MAYRTRASQAASPSKAAGRCAIAPASVPKTKVQPTLIRTAALITAIPQPRDRFQNARPNAANKAGTRRAKKIFHSVQFAVRYFLSAPSISSTAGLGSAGAGNQNMLVAKIGRASCRERV